MIKQMNNTDNAGLNGQDISHPEIIRELFGEPASRDKILSDIRSDPALFSTWNSFSEKDREDILLFLEGRQGLQILYDGFFKHIFRPDEIPERVESLISAILGEPVKILQVLSREGSSISDSGSQVIMEIIVKTQSGAIVTVEMQRIGYLFPGERSSCYIADMIMRQYQLTRSEKGKDFSYTYMRPVTLIVLMEKSSREFREVAPEYIHRRTEHYSSGAKVSNLENVIYISLDTFHEQGQNIIDSKLHAWLTFFSCNEPDKIIELVSMYPEFIPLYKDIAQFRKSPGEVIGMFSEALKIMDRNTTKYMIEELARERDEAVSERDNAFSERDEAVSERNKAVSEVDRLRALLEANGIPLD